MGGGGRWVDSQLLGGGALDLTTEDEYATVRFLFLKFSYKPIFVIVDHASAVIKTYSVKKKPGFDRVCNG